jgi:hypothetical protein
MNNVLFNEYNKIFVGLTDLSRAARAYAMLVPQKLHAMEEVYLHSNQVYSEVEQRNMPFLKADIGMSALRIA